MERRIRKRVVSILPLVPDSKYLRLTPGDRTILAGESAVRNPPLLRSNERLFPRKRKARRYFCDVIFHGDIARERGDNGLESRVYALRNSGWTRRIFGQRSSRSAIARHSRGSTNLQTSVPQYPISSELFSCLFLVSSSFFFFFLLFLFYSSSFFDVAFPSRSSEFHFHNFRAPTTWSLNIKCCREHIGFTYIYFFSGGRGENRETEERGVRM